MAQSGVPRSFGAQPFGRAAFAALELVGSPSAVVVETNPPWRGRYRASPLQLDRRLWQQPAGDLNDAPSSQVLVVAYPQPAYQAAAASRLYYWRRDVADGTASTPIVADAPLRIEATADQRTDLPQQTENPGSARNGAAGPIALLPTVRSDAANPAEILVRARPGHDIPTAWSGVAAIDAESPGPLEWVTSGGSVASVTRIEVEWAATPVVLVSAARVLASPGRRRILTAPAQL